CLNYGLFPRVMQHRFKFRNGACRISSENPKRKSSVFGIYFWSGKPHVNVVVLRYFRWQIIAKPIAPSRLVLDPSERLGQTVSANSLDSSYGLSLLRTVLSAFCVSLEPVGKVSSLVFGLISQREYEKAQSHDGNDAKHKQHSAPFRPHKLMMEDLGV